MKNKLRKEVLIIILLTLLISILINISSQYISDRYFDDEMDNYLYSVANGNEKLNINKLREMDDSEFMNSIYINSFSILIGSIFLWFSIRAKAIYIKELSDSLIYIGEGNLDYKVPIRQNNELTELANSINELSVAFKDRIQFEKKQEKSTADKEREFLIGISHDIRTPLTSVIGYLHVLKDKQYRTEEERDQYTDTMLDKVYLLKKLTDDLLDSEYYSNKSISSINTISKSDFKLQSIDVFKNILDDKFEILINDNTGEFNISNIDSINRLASNLISNLEKYADDKYPIYIDINSKDQYIEFIVTNVCKQDVSSISHKFTDKFYRADQSRELQPGYGLGLSICKNIMENQGGYMNIENISNNSISIILAFKII